MPAFPELLEELHHLLKHLPTSLPTLPPSQSRYARLHDALDPEYVEDLGESAAANRVLEICFPSHEHIPNSNSARIPRIQERGEAIEVLSGFLRKYCSEDPAQAYMQLWASDLIAGAKYCYTAHNLVSYPDPGSPYARYLTPY